MGWKDAHPNIALNVTSSILGQCSGAALEITFLLAGGHVDRVPKISDGQVKFLAVIIFIEMLK